MSSDHLPLYCLVPSAIYETVSCEIVFFSQFTPDLSGECVVESLAFCVVFCTSVFVLFHLSIVLSVLFRFTASDLTLCCLCNFSYTRIAFPSLTNFPLWCYGQIQAFVPLGYSSFYSIFSLYNNHSINLLASNESF